MLVVVGGHSRKIGKTAVVAGLIRRLRGRRWTALKITQFAQGVCIERGGPCDCGPEQNHPFALSEEYLASATDSGRFLAAGAARSFWLRTPAGRLFEAAGAIGKIVDQGENTIIESDSVLDVLDPDLYLVVLDYTRADFKESSRRWLERADAVIAVTHGLTSPLWSEVPAAAWEAKPRFEVEPPEYVTAAVVEFVESRPEAVADGAT
jgi:hypothetical protein